MKRHHLLIITIISFLTLFLVYSLFPSLMTGLGTLNHMSVSVKEDVDIRMTISFTPAMMIGETQRTFTEITNTGTDPFSSTKMEQEIYIYENSTLNLSAYYYDVSLPLNPGLRNEFETVFVPPEAGTYYIKSIVNYDNSRKKVWNVFFVYAYTEPTLTTTPAITPVPSPGPGPAPAPEKVAEINLTYSPKAALYVNDSKLVEVKAKNVGNVQLTNLKLHTSVTRYINTEINPKVVSDLDVGESTTFLISIDVEDNFTESNYTLDFEVVSKECKEEGSIELELISEPIPVEDRIPEKILNYEYLISEVDRDILSAYLKGYDVETANNTLKRAKIRLEEAKIYHEYGDYANATHKLTEVRESLESSIFQLAHAKLRVVVEPAYTPLWIMILIIFLIIVLVIFLIYDYRRDDEERPKLLRNLKENE